VPTLFGVTELEGPNVEASPVTTGEFDEPAKPPPEVPVHGVPGVVSLHQVQATEPVGAPPVEFPVTVAESLQLLPTEVAGGIPGGALIEVVKPGVAGVTVKHSVSLCAATEL